MKKRTRKILSWRHWLALVILIILSAAAFIVMLADVIADCLLGRVGVKTTLQWLFAATTKLNDIYNSVMDWANESA
ncbi:MAG: hypothetical protein ACPGXY_03110 [Alphaproteobacteria bacterium]